MQGVAKAKADFVGPGKMSNNVISERNSVLARKACVSPMEKHITSGSW